MLTTHHPKHLGTDEWSHVISVLMLLMAIILSWSHSLPLCRYLPGVEAFQNHTYGLLMLGNWCAERWEGYVIFLLLPTTGVQLGDYEWTWWSTKHIKLLKSQLFSDQCCCGCSSSNDREVAAKDAGCKHMRNYNNICYCSHNVFTRNGVTLTKSKSKQQRSFF